MRMTKGIALVCTLTLAVSLLGGCRGSSDTKNESSTKIVKVTSVNDKTIKVVVGELEENSNKGASGNNQNETPPAKPDVDSSQNGNQNGNPPAMPEGSNFKKSSKTYTSSGNDENAVRIDNAKATYSMYSGGSVSGNKLSSSSYDFRYASYDVTTATLVKTIN